MPLVHGVHIAVITLAWSLAIAWVWKAVTAARGMPRLPNLLRPEYDHRPSEHPRLVVIVPACNEAANIEATIASLLAQDYGNLHVVAVDDRSIDRTGVLLDEMAASSPERLTALHVTDLPAGWLGKTHAMAFAARHTRAVHDPEWLLFTDGDIIFHPQALRRSLVAAEAERADHFIAMPTPILRSSREAMLMGFLQVLGLWGVRPWKIADPRARDALGVGAFNMLRAGAYLKVGGFDALRMQVLDDLSLAQCVKQAGLRQRVALAPGYVAVHWAAGLRGIVNTMTKNLFAILAFRLEALFAACAVVLLLFLAPCAAILWMPTRVPGALALLAIFSLYVTTSPGSRIPVWTFIAFPASALAFVYSLARSAAVTLRQRGVIWRGTFYPLGELRKQAVRFR